jgi:exodeoxyribonuclease VII large subunit
VTTLAAAGVAKGWGCTQIFFDLFVEGRGAKAILTALGHLSGRRDAFSPFQMPGFGEDLVVASARKGRRRLTVLAGNPYLCSMTQPRSVSVSELTYLIRQRLEGDPQLRGAIVKGEISNLTQHGSGHVYFTLKDEGAQLSCAMFKQVAMQYLRSMPKHGEQVLVQGDISVYPQRGSYQMIVRGLLKAGGEGDLHRKFLETKAKLAAEGLFDADLKRSWPRVPRRIAVVTSPTGAVIRDICNTVRRRFPHVTIVLVPAAVQGERAAEDIVAAISRANALPAIDVLLLARGGGSLEDLWPFNEEAVARAIRASRLPVVTGIGHETDTTIADFAADLRAATPTAAAEQLVPEISQLEDELDRAALILRRNLGFFVENRRQSLDDLAYKMEMRMQTAIDIQRHLLKDIHRELESRLVRGLDLARRELEQTDQALQSHIAQSIRLARQELDTIAPQLQALDLRNVLQRGFSITEIDGKVVHTSTELAVGDTLTTYFSHGKARSRVETLDDND